MAMPRNTGLAALRWAGPLLFAGLALLGLERWWLPVLLAGLATSWLPGRWYCSRACPVAGADAACRVRRRKGPGGRAGTALARIAGFTWVRRAWFGALVLSFVLCLALGERVRLFLWVTLAGVAFSLLSARGAWCGTLCPWGSMMRAESALLRSRPGAQNDKRNSMPKPE